MSDSISIAVRSELVDLLGQHVRDGRKSWPGQPVCTCGERINGFHHVHVAQVLTGAGWIRDRH